MTSVPFAGDGAVPAGVDAAQLRRWPLTALRTVHLELGMQCNVRCAMCFQTDFRPQSVLAERIWRDTLRPAYEVARELILVGGEPTILPNCRALLELALRDYPRLRFSTATNGLRFTGLWPEAFLAQGHAVNFSLNSVRRETYQRIVQFGRFDQVVANLDDLVRRKRACGSALLIRISAVVTSETLDELPEIVEWAAEHGLDQVTLSPDLRGGFPQQAPAYVQAQIAAAYAAAERHPHLALLHLADLDCRYALSHKLTPVRPQPLAVRELAPCPRGFDTLHVSTDGRAHPCCLSWYTYGNLTTQSLAAVWQSAAAYHFRRRLLAQRFPDCWIGCEQNARPISLAQSRLRQGVAALRRNPQQALLKVCRHLGLNSPQRPDPPA